jgi:hypothetical protein
MTIVAIDPGDFETAYCVWDGEKILDFGKQENNKIKSSLQRPGFKCDIVVIEMIASYGMPVGKEIFETCLFIGQLMQLCEQLHIPCKLVYRKEIKIHLCGSLKAKDSNIRQALIDRFGKPGTKNNKGVTYGIAGDHWSALAIAVYYSDNFVPKLKKI